MQDFPLSNSLTKAVLECRKQSQKKIRCQIAGSSMLPSLRPGDWVEINPISAENLKGGEIIAYYVDDVIVAHRLIRKFQRNGKWYFCEKGDNCFRYSWIDEKDLLGRVDAIRREENWIALHYRRRHSWISFFKLFWSFTAPETTPIYKKFSSPSRLFSFVFSYKKVLLPDS